MIFTCIFTFSGAYFSYLGNAEQHAQTLRPEKDVHLARSDRTQGCRLLKRMRYPCYGGRSVYISQWRRFFILFIKFVKNWYKTNIKYHDCNMDEIENHMLGARMQCQPQRICECQGRSVPVNLYARKSFCIYI